MRTVSDRYEEVVTDIKSLEGHSTGSWQPGRPDVTHSENDQGICGTVDQPAMSLSNGRSTLQELH